MKWLHLIITLFSIFLFGQKNVNFEKVYSLQDKGQYLDANKELNLIRLNNSEDSLQYFFLKAMNYLSALDVDSAVIQQNNLKEFYKNTALHKKVAYKDGIVTAGILHSQNNFSLSLKKLFELYENLESNQIKEKSEITHFIGKSFLKQKIPEKSIKYFTESQKLANEIGDSDLEHRNMIYLANVYSDLNDLEKAEELIDTAYKYFDGSNNKIDLFHIKGQRMMLFVKQGKLAEASRLGAEAVNDLKELQLKGKGRQQLKNTEKIVKTYKNPNPTDAEIEQAKIKYLENLEISEKLNPKSAIEQGSILVEQMESGEDSTFNKLLDKNALTSKIIKQQDSILNEVIKNKTIEAETLFQTKNKEKENQELLSQNLIQSKNNKKLFITILGIAVLLIGSLFFIRKIFKNLTIQKERKKEAELRLGGVYHGLTNDLAILSQFVQNQLENHQIEKTEAEKELLYSRLKVLSDKYKKLPNSNSEEANIHEFVNRVFDQSVKSTQDILLENKSEDRIYSFKQKTIVLLLINELIMNSIKYAFPNGKGKIELNFKEDSDNYLIKYRDNGIGMSESDNNEYVFPEYVRDFSEVLNANVDFDFNNGVHYKFEFKK